MKRPGNEIICEALEKSCGIVSDAAKMLGCNRSTLHKWIKHDDELKAAQDDSRDSIVDIAESELIKKAKAGDITANIFILKTLGKSRGYIENSQFNVSHDFDQAIPPAIRRKLMQDPKLIDDAEELLGDDDSDGSGQSE